MVPTGYCPMAMTMRSRIAPFTWLCLVLLPVPIGWEIIADSRVPQRIWHDTGEVARLDLRYGSGGRENAPQPPFTFVEESEGGTQPKILVRDAAGRSYAVKFGEEVQGEVFAPRLAWAAGYYVEPTYYVASGTLQGGRPVGRARTYVKSGGTFRHAVFELRRDNPRYLPNASWHWERNAFVGTRELNGLKVVVMLVSNVDNKDIRDKAEGSNTSMFLDERGGKKEVLYMVGDWGATMGRWGRLAKRARWNCPVYSEQSSEFVQREADGTLRFGFVGKHDSHFKESVRAADVRWLMERLGRLTDRQLRDGLEASGATAEEVGCFTRALRVRLDQLRRVAG